MGNRNHPFGRRSRTTAVARAAAAATSARLSGQSAAEQQSQRRFLALVAGVLLAGTLLVGFSWSTRQLERPTQFDSWQNAYAVFDCHTDAWLEPFSSRANPEGIRSRADGLIYIEPANESVAGDNATLAVFLDAVGARLTDDVLTLPGGTELSENGAMCDDEEAVLQVLRWEHPDAKGPVEVRFEDLSSTRFEADRQAIVIALAPHRATVPIPPSTTDLPPAVTPLLEPLS